MLFTVIEWAGTAGGIIGALILAWNRPWSRWGFPVFLVSTSFLLAVALSRGSAPQTALFAVYTLVNAIGVWRWIVRPVRDTPKPSSAPR